MPDPQTGSPYSADLPLSEPVFLILASLAPEPKHGYAILKEVSEMSRGRVVLSTGTLYGAIKRLLADGWIRRVDETAAQPDLRERKTYLLTGRGRQVLALETERLQHLAHLAAHRLAPEGRDDHH
jgi:DNA-binding PadR family transcriptional regulator